MIANEELDVVIPSDVAPDIGQGEQVELMQVKMNGETFLLPVSDVALVLRPVKMTPVPMAPDHMLGVVNVRGQIMCIVDPGKVFHLKQARRSQTGKTRFLILRHPRMHLGIWVDEVSELHRVVKEALPKLSEDHHGYIRGEIEIEGEAFKVLDTQVLFN